MVSAQGPRTLPHPTPPREKKRGRACLYISLFSLSPRLSSAYLPLSSPVPQHRESYFTNSLCFSYFHQCFEKCDELQTSNLLTTVWDLRLDSRNVWKIYYFEKSADESSSFLPRSVIFRSFCRVWLLNWTTDCKEQSTYLYLDIMAFVLVWLS